MDSKLRFGLAREQDHHGILDLLRLCEMYSPSSHSKIDQGESIVAKVAQRIVGNFSFMRHNKDWYYVHGLAIHPEYRRRGIAEMLIRLGEEHMLRCGARGYRGHARNEEVESYLVRTLGIRLKWLDLRRWRSGLTPFEKRFRQEGGLDSLEVKSNKKPTPSLGVIAENWPEIQKPAYWELPSLSQLLDEFGILENFGEAGNGKLQVLIAKHGHDNICGVISFCQAKADTRLILVQQVAVLSSCNETFFDIILVALIRAVERLNYKKVNKGWRAISRSSDTAQRFFRLFGARNYRHNLLRNADGIVIEKKFQQKELTDLMQRETRRIVIRVLNRRYAGYTFRLILMAYYHLMSQ